MSRLKRCALLFTAIVAMGAVSCSQAQNEVDEPTDTEEPTCKPDDRPVYTISDKYEYTISKPFEKSLDSFEAWILAPQDSIGGTILGNYYNDNRGMPGSITYSLDALGRVSMTWDQKLFAHTFTKKMLDDAKWHHIAVIRKVNPDNANQSKFALYIDGEFVEESEYALIDDAICSMPQRIGVDYSQWMNQKTPFDGYIKQVTCYTGEISESRIKSDMNNENITDTNNGTLLGNYNLGVKRKESVAKETSGNGNDAILGTFEKFVDYTQTNDYDYTIVGVPDVQTITNYRPDDVYNMFDWIAANKDSQKIAFCLQTGDLSDFGNRPELYNKTADAMQVLYDEEVPISFVQGNHDYDNNCSGNGGRPSENFNNAFPYSMRSQNPWFGGSFNNEESMSNTYNLYEVGGAKYLVINLEFGPRQEVIRWASDLCSKYQDRRVIILTHDFLDANGQITDSSVKADATNYGFASSAKATSGVELWNGLVKKHSNIFMTVSGHINSDDIVYTMLQGDNNNKVHNFLIDVQASQYNREGIGLDIICLYRVNEEKKEIYTEYYSPRENKWWNVQNQFTIDFSDDYNYTI